MPQPLSQNRSPDCLALELAVTPVQSSTPELLELYVTLRFQEHWEHLGAGRVKLGLTGGSLHLKLSNCKMPPSRSHPLELAELDCRAIAEGTAENPIWALSANSGNILNGSLNNVKLPTVELTGTPAIVEATFTVSASELQVSDAEGLWSHSISTNKLAILDRKIALVLLSEKLQPYLSRAWWRSDSEVQQQPTPEASLDIAQIEGAIERIKEAETDDFLELAKKVGLNPAEDFVGAKLLGTNLSSADLSGANLRRVYLRGADLCDIDLSNADLNEANLGGADMSGAYLSEADLGGANLRRASLALANISGAYLVGANLSEANLSNANLSDSNLNGANLTSADLTGAGVVLANLTDVELSDAKVENARFKDNPGLTEEMKHDLQQRGAIFED